MNHNHTFETERLLLIPATVPALRAAAEQDRPQMASLLEAEVTADWPPDLLQDALAPTADAIESGKSAHPWATYFVFLQRPRRLIGVTGFKSAPTDDGRVEVGYSVINSEQRRGYATEATLALIEFAFTDDRVTTIIADTMPDLIPSIRVMEKIGMTRDMDYVSAEPGEERAIRHTLDRGMWKARRS
ncbi:MAG TPA: GNAT family N-acetyltransferase [Phycisphaerae bacterium]|nr:GNAT family N-acetyltransferase [Phycisphaerae bacterium]HRW55849.1 GNAT family N-acetyltransferase [Phycisphaerae bacterium]